MAANMVVPKQQDENVLPVVIVEAMPGPMRLNWLQEYCRKHARDGSRTFMISSDFDVGGVWAGVKDLFLALLPDIREQRPDLVQQHAYELVLLLPQLRRSLNVANPTLTDLASEEEKTRNYAADRAFRVVHGLIDLFSTWKKMHEPDIHWTIVCDDYDAASSIAVRFFRELMRRTEGFQINLVAATCVGGGEDARTWFNVSRPREILKIDLPVTPAENSDGSEAQQLADELEMRIGTDRLEMQIHLPDLIRLWKSAGRSDKVVYWKYFGLATYCNLGFYEDALHYAEDLLPLAVQCKPNDARLQSWIIIKSLHGHIGARNIHAALKLAYEEGMKLLDQAPPIWRSQLLYLIAILHARYEQPRNLAKGEECLNRALAVIQESDLPDSERYFHSVFNRNGVAMIRSFQGRHQEALELCRMGIEELNTHLDPGKHQLHRSVLFYNIAQVHSALGSCEDAIKYYSMAMAMDPNYSEYHNERGSVFLRMGRLQEARADYLRAIELSPPYSEVFVNLGQCYREMGAMADAIEAYSRALDLEPDLMLAILGRAKAHEELGHVGQAIADYTAALAKDSGQWEVLASRGVTNYEAGNLLAALADFGRAIELKADHIDLYQNRAIVFTDLHRFHAAEQDLKTALALHPTMEDRKALESRLEAVQRATTMEPQPVANS
ncbi:MAG: tetratricopeptide repeat protein [Terriglobales bacterium]